MTGQIVDQELERLREAAAQHDARFRADVFDEAAAVCEREEKDAKDAAHARGAARCAYRLRQKAKQERAAR